jgi:hypothetical protein
MRGAARVERRPCRFRDFLEERRMNMRMLASAVAAVALMGMASLAYAATTTGQITDINQTKHLIALDTGAHFMVPDRTDLSTFNGLDYSAKKAGQLWLTGNVSVCLSGGATKVTLKNTQATSNVPMLARLALPSTQSAQIVNDRIKLGGGGWGGTFIGQ